MELISLNDFVCTILRNNFDGFYIHRSFSFQEVTSVKEDSKMEANMVSYLWISTKQKGLGCSLCTRFLSSLTRLYWINNVVSYGVFSLIFKKFLSLLFNRTRRYEQICQDNHQAKSVEFSLLGYLFYTGRESISNERKNTKDKRYTSYIKIKGFSKFFPTHLFSLYRSLCTCWM